MIRTKFSAWLVIAVLFLGYVPVSQAAKAIPEAEIRANESLRIGNYEVHYSAFSSTFIEPTIAAAFQLERNQRTGIINIAIRDVQGTGQETLVGRAATGRIAGHVSNLLGQKSALDFKEVKDGEAIYYLANFTYNNDERLTFDLNIWPGKNERPGSIRFNQQFFVSE